MPDPLDLDDDRMELAAVRREAIAHYRNHSPRVKRLRAILDKLKPPAPRPERHPARKPAGEPSHLLARKKRR